MNRRLVVAGAAIIMITLAVAGHWGRQRLARAVARPVSPPLAGTRLPGIDWPEPHAALAIVISASCDEDEATVDFLRRAAQAGKRAGLHVMAVSAAPPTDVRECLARRRIPIGDVQRARLEQLAAVTAPSLILVDGTAGVRASWSGRFSADDQANVLQQLERARAPRDRESPLRM